MDSHAFDGLTRALAGEANRRRLLGSLGSLTMGGAVLALFGQSDAGARRKKKRKNKKQKGDSPNQDQGQDQNPSQNQCADGIQNGSESDVDCGGGTCPRCQGGQICTSSTDCHTALCTGGTCQSCAAPSDCGLDSNGDTCFCRDNAARPGERMCTRKTCTLFVGGTCADCATGEQCAPAGPGAIECCAPCGA
jgi:hypothetical protein